MTGQNLIGIPIIVQLTEEEKNRQAQAAARRWLVSSNSLKACIRSVGDLVKVSRLAPVPILQNYEQYQHPVTKELTDKQQPTN